MMDLASEAWATKESRSEPTSLSSPSKVTDTKDSPVGHLTASQNGNPSPQNNSLELPIKPQDANKPCHFAKLPLELRYMVYEYATCTAKTGLLVSTSTLLPFHKSPPILQVSHHIRAESASIYYEHGNFSVTMHFADIAFQQWMAKIPQSHSAALCKNKKMRISVATDTLLFQFLVGSAMDYISWTLYFNRLASRWLFCSDLPSPVIKWEYEFRKGGRLGLDTILAWRLHSSPLFVKPPFEQPLLKMTSQVKKQILPEALKFVHAIPMPIHPRRGYFLQKVKDEVGELQKVKDEVDIWQRRK
ncbi:hypothetical protein IQ07DRAFT_648402 [Pyrenochaeta sp. DS3sAY3a]|nr:hypothetical protein IQ07DRAFT_648402 [Pyrenochaeta sp. DS3sAY3a]